MPATQALPAASFLQLLWLASPALPVGGFAYSEGFEMAVDSGRVENETAAANWLQDQLGLGLARCELPLIAQAIAAWRQTQQTGQPRLRQLNDWLLQTRETSELRAQSEQMGRSLLEWLRNHETADAQLHAEQIAFCASLPPTYPIVFALAAAKTQAGLRDCLLAYAFGWAENMTQAAIKSIPLGQSAGQRILGRLAAAIPPAVENAIHMRDEQRQTFSPMLAILSSQHETQYSRLFRS